MPKKIAEVRLKIIQPIICEWTCPKCKKKNTERYYNAPGRTRVQCDYCGILFVATR